MLFTNSNNFFAQHSARQSSEILGTIFQTEPNVLIGTPSYLSPEQIEGKPADARSDLFALGALFYECLAGKPLFAGATGAQIFAQIFAQIVGAEPAPRKRSPRKPGSTADFGDSDENRFAAPGAADASSNKKSPRAAFDRDARGNRCRVRCGIVALPL